MPSLRDIRKRIRSVRNTQQITRAMKLVAAAKLRRAQDAALSSRPYSEAMLGVIRSVGERSESTRHPLLAERSEGHRLVVVISADRGLCGGFNVNVCKRAAALMDEFGDDARLFVVGRKANDYFKRRSYPVLKHRINVFAKLTWRDGVSIGQELMKHYLDGEAREVHLVYNRFRSLVAQDVTVERLMPLSAEAGAGPREVSGIDYIYEPGPDAILEQLLPLGVHTLVYHSLQESAAAEQAARMMAMDSATKNAGEMIEQLTLNMNKARQASITRELIEVVSGAQALAD